MYSLSKNFCALALYSQCNVRAAKGTERPRSSNVNNGISQRPQANGGRFNGLSLVYANVKLSKG